MEATPVNHTGNRIVPETRVQGVTMGLGSLLGGTTVGDVGICSVAIALIKADQYQNLEFVYLRGCVGGVPTCCKRKLTHDNKWW